SARPSSRDGRRSRISGVDVRRDSRVARTSTPEMRERFAGVMQTVWAPAESFLDQFYGRVPPDRERGDPIDCCKRYLAEMKELAGQPQPAAAGGGGHSP
ncbi:MAG TPA: hypothetical protein PLS95_18415, partial [Thermoanaerobaculales bacterium]|nr:hypothetical protein [Thermoanaerobaculales bacterium]